MLKAIAFSFLRINEQHLKKIRIKTAEAYRLFYIAQFSEAVYVVFHSFNQKTQKTSKQDLELGQQRCQTVISSRK